MVRHGLTLRFKTTVLHHRSISTIPLAAEHRGIKYVGLFPLETKQYVKLGKTYQDSLLVQLMKYSEFYAMQEISRLSIFKILGILFIHEISSVLYCFIV